MDEFVESFGYVLETYEVVTEDGYILTLHRIPKRITKLDEDVKKPAVLMMHGGLTTSFSWVILGSEKGWAFRLVDGGYDVWMGNSRGNTYSRKHVSLSPDKQRSFWNYSQHEIGVYDIPAMIDYVLNKTNHQKLTYVGHSQGITSFLIMASLKSEYNDKIILVNALAPVTDMHDIKLPIGPLFLSGIFDVVERWGSFDLGANRIWGPIFQSMLALPFGQHLVASILRGLGTSNQQMNTELFPAMSKLFPNGLSIKQLVHYVQTSRSGIFRPFNYGKQVNLQKYNNIEPPPYDLGKVTAPMVLYYGDNDYLINNDRLLNTVLKQMPNVVKTYEVPHKGFNHCDFILGNNIAILQDEMLKDINMYNNVP